MLIACFNSPGQGIVVYRGYYTSPDSSVGKFLQIQSVFLSNMKKVQHQIPQNWWPVASPSTYLVWCLDTPCWKSRQGTPRRKMISSCRSNTSWQS